MMSFSVPPGYQRTAPIKRPKLDGFTSFIEQWLQDDLSLPRKQRHTAKRIFERLLDEHGFKGGYQRRTIGQSLLEPQRIHGLPVGALEPMLAEMGLPADIAQRFPAELSGGQLQRVTIARALALEPDCLICDEITSALDVSWKAQILNALSELQERRNLAILFISHDWALVEHFCDRVLVMKGGHLAEEGTVMDATYASPKSAKVHETV